MDGAASMYMTRGFTKYQAKFLAAALGIIVRCFLIDPFFIENPSKEYFWKCKTRKQEKSQSYCDCPRHRL